MNLPNKLTMLRIILVPVFLVLFYLPFVPYRYFIALLVFAVASITDFFDGKIARARNLITNFGKLMDPMADKLVVTSAMAVLCEAKWVPAWVLVTILAREFLVTAMRTVAAGSGGAIDVSIWGKAKTMVQMIWISYTLALFCAMEYLPLSPGLEQISWALFNVFMYITVALTIYSGAQYIFKNTRLFADA